MASAIKIKMQNEKSQRKIIILLLNLFLITSFVFPSQVSAFISINEILPNPSAGDDWIELYKSEVEEVDISGWQIEDATGIVKTFPDGTKIASDSSFMQVLVSNRLNKNDDLIKLKDKNSNIVDEKSYNQDPGAGVSIGRFPDGSSNWGILISASPNATNSTFIPTPTPTFTPTLTPTPVPSRTPTPVPTLVPTSVPSTIPTKTPTVTITKPVNTPTIVSAKITQIPITPISEQFTASSEGQILGETAESAKNEDQTQQKRSMLPIFILFFGGGLLFIAAAVILSWKQMKSTKGI